MKEGERGKEKGREGEGETFCERERKISNKNRYHWEGERKTLSMEYLQKGKA